MKSYSFLTRPLKAASPQGLNHCKPLISIEKTPFCTQMTVAYLLLLSLY